MSFAALAWAAKYRASRAADKLVLLAYADRHSEETGCAYPSLAWLCEFSSLNRKTVVEAVSRLETAGALIDTGERQGTTKQIKVYRVEIGTIPKSAPSQKRNGTEKVVKQYRKRDTEPIRTISSTKASPSTRKHASAEAFPKPDWANAEHWRDFLANRRRKNLPNTASAHAKMLRDVERFADAAWPPGLILQHAAEKGWAGIYDPRNSEGHIGQRSHNHYRSADQHPGGRTGAAADDVFGCGGLP